MKRTTASKLNVDIYRSTISELSPCTNDLVAAAHRGALRVICRVARMIQDWGIYADDYMDKYDVGILEDGVLGPEWETIGRSLRALLNGEVFVDAGTADACIVRIFQNEGLEL